MDFWNLTRTAIIARRFRCKLLLGTLRSDNDDVHENVAETQTSHHFKLFRDYPNSPCYVKEREFMLELMRGEFAKFGQR